MTEETFAGVHMAFFIQQKTFQVIVFTMAMSSKQTNTLGSSSGPNSLSIRVYHVARVLYKPKDERLHWNNVMIFSGSRAEGSINPVKIPIVYIYHYSCK